MANDFRLRKSRENQPELQTIPSSFDSLAMASIATMASNPFYDPLASMSSHNSSFNHISSQATQLNNLPCSPNNSFSFQSPQYCSRLSGSLLPPEFSVESNSTRVIEPLLSTTRYQSPFPLTQRQEKRLEADRYLTSCFPEQTFAPESSSNSSTSDVRSKHSVVRNHMWGINLLLSHS
ncbi:hypothetical protein O181_016206 [Austropuccinia psidii MF-1]|uniref:Uncharacterized protein n=1 Tax=Austropuccinia psidii MF-1 TaxID=1389203 RepID=A0A9Q3C194_9BASI|nr:hypothetical protein [Austropuccinia psidii MF-1]